MYRDQRNIFPVVHMRPFTTCSMLIYIYFTCTTVFILIYMCIYRFIIFLAVKYGDLSVK